MAVKFNPFTGQLQIDEKGSGGGSSYIDGEVATYNDLPLDGTAALNSAWLVRSASGIWPVSRKQAGIYIRTATGGVSRDADFTYAGTMPDVFSDAVLTIYDEASTTRTGQFNLGSITAGQNRVLTWPDGNGTIARTEDFAAPPVIGSTTPAAGSFSTLNATGTTELVNGGTTAGPFRLYNISSAANANYERGFMRWSSNVLQIGTEKGGTGSARALEFQTDGTTRLTLGSTGTATFFTNVISTAADVQFDAAFGGIRLGANRALGWSNLSGNQAAGTPDVRLLRDAANILAQYNGVNAQAYRLYNTVSGTGNVNFDRVNFRWASNEFIIDAEAGGTGTLRGIKLGSASTSLLGFYGVAPVDQPATVSDPAGGGTIDTEARTAINAIIDRLQELGLIA